MRKFSDIYFDFLKNGPLAGLNLTAINDSDEFYKKQIIDSVEPFSSIGEIADLAKKVNFVVDIGFGGGFPLIPLANTYPSIEFIGFESKNKKVCAVKKIIDHFSLNNVSVFKQRYEDLNFDRQVLVTLKGVEKIEKTLQQITNTKEIYIMFYKGPNARDLELVPESTNSYKLILEKNLVIEEQYQRTVFIYKKMNVPRGTVKKNLVKFSNLI